MKPSRGSSPSSPRNCSARPNSILRKQSRDRTWIAWVRFASVENKLPQNSDGSTLSILLWIAWIYWTLYARTSSTSSDGEQIEGDGEKAPDSVQRILTEDVSIAVAPGPRRKPDAFDRDIVRALKEVERRNRSFSKEEFLRGAARAYEEVATAFASGNRATLEALASRDVYADLAAAIAEDAVSDTRPLFVPGAFFRSRPHRARLRRGPESSG